MTKKEKVEIILNFLEKKYNVAECELEFKQPHELLIATRLSAQCSDKKVNFVTKELFLKYCSVDSFAKASFEDVEELIRPCGLYRKKAKDIVNICRKLISVFNGQVPSKMEELLSLPGVGRKTANLILGVLYNQPAIVVDTHVGRICNRLNLVQTKNPNKIEEELVNLIPKKVSLKFCHRLVHFGREVCTARKPSCFDCDLALICHYNLN